MKTRFLFQTGIVIVLSALPLLTGCTQQSAGNTPAYVITSNTPPPPTVTAVPAAPAPAAAEMPLPAADSNAPATAPEPIPVTEPVVPANLRLTTSLNEIIRLTHSGVDEGVILTYITNSPAMFLLGAEEIVYLNDLGVTSPVITAMLQRDQTLKAAWGNPEVAETPANPEPVAVAPTYVESPQATANTEAPTVQVSNNYFYDNLSPYGAWVDVDGYGRVWRPTVVVTSPGWQPYRDRGRWIYSDAGYYWLSDYSWGSITFHYGRWFSHPRWGWCWWPDTVWAPSWVTWRYDNSYCGWAPLPPRSYYRHGGGFYYHDRRVSIGFDFGLGIYAYTYVPWSRFHDPRPYYHCLPYARSVAVHRQTTVVNDYGPGNNNTVINRGIPKDRVREHTRNDVRPVAVRAERSNTLRPARLERDGRTLVVNRPALPLETKLETTPTAGERGGSRLVNPTAPASSLVTSPTRTVDRVDRSPRGEITHDTRPTATVPVTSRPAPVTSPTTPTVRPAPRDGREAGYRNENNSAPERSRPAVTPVTRPTESTPTAPVAAPIPTPARTPTPIFSKPVVIQTTPQLPTRPFVSPTPAPTRPPTATPPNTTFNGVTSGVNTRNPGASASRPANSWQNNNESRPDAVNRATSNQNREENSVRPPAPDRPGRSIAVERSSRPEQSAPTFRSQAPTVTPNSTPSPAPARPSYTPPSNPQPAPRIESRSQPAPRVDSRPQAAPSRSEAGRPSNAGSDSRPGSSPGGGNQRSR